MKKSLPINKRLIVRDITVIALFTAIIAVCSQIIIPMPFGVPFTLQTLAIAVAGYALGEKRGLCTTLCYILSGVLGVPVFSSFQGGISVLFGKTGGFILGFVFLCFACGAASTVQNKLIKTALGIAGVLLCHLVGTVWFAYLTNVGFFAAALLVSVPFIVKDAASIVLAAFIADKLRKSINF